MTHIEALKPLQQTEIQQPSADAPLSDQPAFYSYRLVPAGPLPTVDLSQNLMTKVLSPQAYERFMRFLRWHYKLFANVYRLGVAVFLLAFFLNRRVSSYFGLVALLLSAPVMVNIGLLSIGILKLLVWEYDVWAYTVMNVLNCVLLALALNDWRALGVVPWCFGIQNCILLDANVRTAPSAIRGIILGVPFAVIMGVSVATHLVDTTRSDFRLVHLPKGFDIDLDELCMNWSLTLAMVLARELYNKHTLVACNIIRCVVYRCPLKLDQCNATTIVQVAQTFQNHRASRAPSICHVTTMSGRHLLDLRQQLHVVPSKNNHTMSAWDTIWPRLTPRKRLREAALAGVYSCGVAGITLTSTSMALIVWDAHTRFKASNPTNGTMVDALASADATYKRQHIQCFIVAQAALVTTLMFVGMLTVSFHRRLVVRLVTLFNFLFPSSQLLAASVCLMQATRWDSFSCMAIGSWCIWFHFCLCLDALTPRIKDTFGWRKRFAAVILVCALLSVCHLTLSILFAPKDMFDDFVVHLSYVRISISIRTFLFNRLLTIWLWNVRLAWRCAVQPEEELMLVRGTVEYRSPLEMFPVDNPAATIPALHQ